VRKLLLRLERRMAERPLPSSQRFHFTPAGAKLSGLGRARLARSSPLASPLRHLCGGQRGWSVGLRAQHRTPHTPLLHGFFLVNLLQQTPGVPT